jgi:putative ABC transport system permease protein
LQARVGGAEFDPVRFESTLVSGGNIADLISQAKNDGAVFISETFASKHRLQAGDTLTLPSPKGMIDAPVVAVYRDYASEQGYVLMDLERYAILYEDNTIDSVAIHLDAAASPDAVREVIAQRAVERGLASIELRSNRDIRDSALVAFDQTFAVTYILQVIAMVVAVLGVATTLLAQLLDRRHEIITLRTLGADRWRVARVLVLEAGLIGIAGIVLGIAGGLSLAWILTTVVMTESFGWTIQFTVPWVVLLQTVALLFGATLVAGIGPAMRVLNGSAER